VADVLVDYIENPDDVECAVYDIIEAVENEMIWARLPDSAETPRPRSQADRTSSR
jgi:hypothetical protein